MKTARRVLAFVITCVISSSGLGAAHAVPDTIAFSALVRDERGPVAGAVNAVFRLFDAPSGGEPIWEERHPSVPVEAGIFNVELGSLADEALSELIFDGSTLYLEIVIEGDVMQQRITIQSVPYAYRAATADTLDGRSADDFLPRGAALLCPSGQKMRGIDGPSGDAVCVSEQSAASGGGLSLSGGAYSIANSGVTSSKIADGTITASDIGNAAVTSSEIADGTISASDIGNAAVTSSELASGAVTSGKIASGAVTLDKIGFNLTRNVSGPYYAHRDSGGTTVINLKSSSNSFCALSRVLMTEADNGDEWAECYVGIQNGYWILRAKSFNDPDRSDPIVYCGAVCISW